MTETDDLAGLIERLTPQGRESLGRCAARLDTSLTDTIDRALRLYAAAGAAPEGTAVTFERGPDDERTVVVFDSLPPERWKRWALTYWPMAAVAFAAGLLAGAGAVWAGLP